MKLWAFDMCKKERSFVNIWDSTFASDEIVWNVLSARKAGEDAMNKIFNWFTTTGADVIYPKRAQYNDPKKKQKVYNFTNEQEKQKKYRIIPEYEPVGNVVVQFDEKRLDLKHGAIYSKVDQKKSSSKSLFRNNPQLISHVPCTTTEPPGILCCICIVDAMHMVNMNIYHHPNTNNIFRMGKTNV